MDTSTIESVEIAIFAAQLTDLLAGTGREGTPEEMCDLARSWVAPTYAERLATAHFASIARQIRAGLDAERATEAT